MGSLGRRRQMKAITAFCIQTVLAVVAFPVMLVAQQAPATPALPAATLFSKYCQGCHGEGATGTDRGPGLVNSRTLRGRSESQIGDIIHNGTGGGMPAFPLPPEELQSLARWVRSMNASA